MMEVNLAPPGRVSADKREKTYTDNISPHGIRVRSTCPWHRGERAEVTPIKGEVSMLGEVVYCQKIGKDRFFLGLKFRDKHIPWSILTRFNGLALVDALCAMRW